MIIEAIIINQPNSGEFEERIYDHDSPWNSKIGLGLNSKKIMRMIGAVNLGEHLVKYQFLAFLERD